MNRCYQCGDDLQFEKNTVTVRYRRIPFRFCSGCAEKAKARAREITDNEIDVAADEILLDFVYHHFDEQEPVDTDHEDRLAYQSEVIEARLAERRREFAL